METIVLFFLIAFCFLAQMFLSHHFQKSLKDLDDTCENRVTQIEKWVENRDEDLNDKIKDLMLKSYKPKFKYGDLVECKYNIVFGENILRYGKVIKGRVVNIKLEASTNFVKETLTVDTGHGVKIFPSNDCTLQQPEPIKRGRPVKK